MFSALQFVIPALDVSFLYISSGMNWSTNALCPQFDALLTHLSTPLYLYIAEIVYRLQQKIR